MFKKTTGIGQAGFGVIVCYLTMLLLGTHAYATEQDSIALLNQTGKAFAAVAKKVAPAVVHVRVEKKIQSTQGEYGQNPFDFFNDPFFERFFGPGFRHPQQPGNKGTRPRMQQGAGSGFIISEDGYILTNNHVVADAETITVRLDNKKEYPANIIGSDQQSDVALIKIDAEGLPTVPLGDSEAIDVGEWVIAIGSPFELSQTVTVGVVSAKGRNRVGINDYENFIQTDAAINPGNSGGPLLNIHGQVVGINTAIFSRSGGYMGIGFAIPINMAKSIQEQLLQDGRVTRGWLGVGIQDINNSLAESFQLESTQGVLLTEISPKSPADNAGLQQGDVLLSMGSKPLSGVADLRNRVAMTTPGAKVEFTLNRNGQQKKVTVTIGEQPADFGVPTTRTTETKQFPLNQLGLSLQDLEKEVAEKFGYSPNQGVLIAGVAPDSIAARAGLQPGQLIEEVNRKRVRNLKELKKAIETAGKNSPILLRIRVGQHSRYIVLKP